MTAAAPAFRKGGEAAQEASKNSGGGFRKTNFFGIEENEQAVLRYLTDKDDWIFVDQHAGAVTKPAPKDFEGNWPKSMPAVCRHDEAFAGMFDGCYICDNKVQNTYGKVSKPTVRIWALACLREEVIGTKELVEQGVCTEDQIGKRIGFTDATRKVPKFDDEGKAIEGEEVEERAIVVVNMAPNNYFNALTATGQVYGGTVCDRDYVVKRSGKGTDTEYSNVPLDATPNLKPGTESWKRYEKAIEEQGLDLGTLVMDRASDEYYGRFWDPAYKDPKGEPQASGKEADVPAKADDGVDEDRLAAMRERVRATTAPAASEID